jgi:hypothetical protein
MIPLLQAMGFQVQDEERGAAAAARVAAQVSVERLKLIFRVDCCRLMRHSRPTDGRAGRDHSDERHRDKRLD